MLVDSTRRVGAESQKTFKEKVVNGFFQKFMQGNGCEIGYGSKNETILPFCDGFDLNTPGYDGRVIPVVDGYYDYLYSSHCLEHIIDWHYALFEWMRVIKKGGFLIILVPHRDLYEKKLEMPSQFSGEHVRFYTPAILLTQIEWIYNINTYRIRHLKDNDEGYIYTDPPNVHGKGQYEIECVVQKL